MSTPIGPPPLQDMATWPYTTQAWFKALYDKLYNATFGPLALFDDSGNLNVTGIITANGPLQIKADGGSGIAANAYIVYMKLDASRQVLVQLNSTNDGLDFWYFNGTSWTKTGSITAGAISGTTGAYSSTNTITTTDNSNAQLILRSTAANTTAKASTIGATPYTSANQSFALIAGYSDATDNYVTIGGSRGGMNAATHVRAYVAANNNTDVGAVVFDATSAGVAVTGAISSTTFTDDAGNLIISSTNPTISSGFGTNPSITANNTAAFKITTGTGGTDYLGVITMPTAPNGWAFSAHELGSVYGHIVANGISPTQISLRNYNSSTGANLPWGTGSTILIQATAF